MFMNTDRWISTRESIDTEAERLAFLRRPLPSNMNDPALFEHVKVRVIGGFCVDGKVPTIGSVISIPLYVARDLNATKKIEFC